MIVAVPGASPVTTPAPVIEAIEISELLHAPPGVASVSVMSEPSHTTSGPTIGAGIGFIVITAQVVHPETA